MYTFKQKKNYLKKLLHIGKHIFQTQMMKNQVIDQ